MLHGPIHDCFGPPPASLAPSVRVRRWDEAALAGLFGFSAAYIFIGLALWRDLPLLGECPGLSFFGFLGEALHPIGVVEEGAELWTRAWLSLGAGLLSGSLSFAYGLRPHSRLRHVSGPRLLSGDAARKAARAAAVADRGGKPGFLKLAPDLELDRDRFTRHLFVIGAVGGGKTQILMNLLVQIFAMPRQKRPKLFCLDVKGDFTQKFKAPIISPWDARSLIWDIGRDLDTPAAAATFAQTLLPVEGSNPFWPEAARSVLVGAITSLRIERGTQWGWGALADRVNSRREAMAELLTEHAPKAAVLMGDEDSPTSLGILATLAAHTVCIDNLAAAWGNEEGRKKISLREWAVDEFRGPGQLIVQAGQDAALTRSYIGAMVKLLEQTIINPAMPDSAERTLLFVLDELPALKLNVSAAIDKGRSKGVVVVAACQSMLQLQNAMNQQEAQALMGMLGTHVVCRMQMSEDRDQVAALFGRQRVCFSNGPTAHEETRSVVDPSVLSTELGRRQVSRKVSETGYAIRALVAGVGPDVLMLDWPVIAPKNVRPAHVPAAWTLPDKTRPESGPKVPVQPEPQTKPTNEVGAVVEQLLAQLSETPVDQNRKESVP
ncbi:MAG: type IV secretion system DNA-binding domain-containing protein [Rudaea sp.]|uniref:type IV secretion system DNA-binding domain-containing protein n=1 Tax=unclassified Rudaea TaxID=2627037 RepID=UPI0010F6B857|nr:MULTISPECIES: type IV secretion system DNA-binding domain-containing protein [unclassified Rudaea]MBN8884475.1 type IV secretion system DNA-binding domain-containing protein [Rudaea sp.]